MWKDVYSMPIHWRRFYLNKLIEFKKKEKEEHDKLGKKGSSAMPRVRITK